MDDILKEIALMVATGRTVVFCGAGISKESGLPLATELQADILNWSIRLDEDTKTTLAQHEESGSLLKDRFQRQKDDLCRTLLSSNLPFEFFFQLLTEVVNIKALIEIFSEGEPNLNHITLARLAKEGYLKTICTTNFDTLIERALAKEGLVRKVDFVVSAGTGDFERIDWNSEQTHVVKLHGTCEDFDSIAVTLKGVSERRLSSPRKAVVDQIFSRGPHESVLILGYSCSDYFDIVPQIRASFKTGKRIFLVNHSPGANEVVRTGTATPFEHFPDLVILRCDTRRVIESLWTNVLQEDVPATTVRQPAWRLRVRDWYESNLSQLGEDFCLAFVGLLLFYSSRFSEALQYFYQVTFSERRSVRPGHLSNMAACLEALGHYSQALQLIELAIETAATTDDKGFEAKSLSNLGRVYTRMTRYKEALDCHRRGLNSAREINDAKTVCEHLCNMMLTLCQTGEYDEALAHGQEALQIARDSGYTHAEGRVLNEIGNVYHLLHDNEEALKNYEAAREIAIQLGDREAEGNALGNMANAYGRLGEYLRSIRVNHDALVIAREIKDRLGEVTRLFNIATANFHLRDFEESRRYYEEALSSATGFLDDRHPLVAQSQIMVSQLRQT